MSPIHISYLIVGITLILLFVIFRFVKDPDERKPIIDTRHPSGISEPFEVEDEEKPDVDFSQLNFTSRHRNITEKEYQEFIEKHDLHLPKLYKEIMLTANGGKPNKPYYKDGRATFLPIKYGEFTVDDTLRLSGELFLPFGFYPFIDNGEYGYAINMNKNQLYQIFFWDETGEFEYECSSLQDFLNELDESDDY